MTNDFWKDYEPVQDKVTLIQTNVGIGERAMEAYEAAKQRTRQSARSAWVGLTDEEVMNATRKEGHELLDFIYEYGTGSEGTEERVVAICKAIEAKLKEKNT
jgi:hypothetical protein